MWCSFYFFRNLGWNCIVSCENAILTKFYDIISFTWRIRFKSQTSIYSVELPVLSETRIRLLFDGVRHRRRLYHYHWKALLRFRFRWDGTFNSTMETRFMIPSLIVYSRCSIFVVIDFFYSRSWLSPVPWASRHVATKTRRDVF